MFDDGGSSAVMAWVGVTRTSGRMRLNCTKQVDSTFGGRRGCADEGHHDALVQQRSSVYGSWRQDVEDDDTVESGGSDHILGSRDTPRSYIRRLDDL